MPRPAAAHGPFDSQAHKRDPLTWLSQHQGAVLAGLAAATLAGAAAAARS